MGISFSEILVVLILVIIFLKPKHISDSSYKVGKMYRILLKKIINIKNNIKI